MSVSRFVLRKSRPAGKQRRALRRGNMRRLRGRRRVRLKSGGTFNEGYNEGYNKGYNGGHEVGYRQGRYDGEGRNEWKEGVEGLIDSFLPEYEILPDFTADQIIAAGVEHLRPHIRHLLRPEQLAERIIHALDSGTPFSLVRVGDGELLTLAQECVLTIEQVKEQGSFLGYAGVDVPDLEARDQVRDAIKQATVVGIPKLRIRNFQPLAIAVFQAHGIDYGELALTDSLINYYLYQAGMLSRIVSGRRVLIVGQLAEELAGYMRQNGVHVVGAVAPVQGVKDVPRVMDEIARHEFDLALVAAGVSAVILSQRIASEMGKVALDFGHLANAMVKGEAPFK